MGQVANRRYLDHSRATFEGVQIAQQGFHFLAALRVGLPAQQGCARTVDDVEAFLEEDLQQLRVITRRIVGGHLCSGVGRVGAALAPLRDGLDQCRAIAQRLLALQLLQQLREAVVALLQQLAKLGAIAQAPVHQPLVKAFQLVGQVTHRSDLGHPRPTLEGVQVALQRQQRRRVLRFREPTLQGLPGALQNVHGLFEKNRLHFIVRRQWRRRGLPEFGGDAAKFGNTQGATAVAADQAHRGRIQAFIEQIAQGLHAGRLVTDFLACRQFVEHVDQGFMGTLGLVKEPFADRQAAFLHRAVQVEQGLAQLIHRVQVGQVRAFAQGRQLIQQGTQFLTLAGVLLPTAQQVFGV